ncbi:hypothetical protein NKH49_23535 [Mesorhizobium sp. M1088]|uniref:hypothetical protein n=1 Tax=Mesorhizobium sp. M1088 TaxID=2957056 RepID=UPI003335C9A1
MSVITGLRHLRRRRMSNVGIARPTYNNRPERRADDTAVVETMLVADCQGDALVCSRQFTIAERRNLSLLCPDFRKRALALHFPLDLTAMGPLVKNLYGVGVAQCCMQVVDLDRSG